MRGRVCRAFCVRRDGGFEKVVVVVGVSVL